MFPSLWHQLLVKVVQVSQKSVIIIQKLKSEKMSQIRMVILLFVVAFICAGVAGHYNFSPKHNFHFVKNNFFSLIINNIQMLKCRANNWVAFGAHNVYGENVRPDGELFIMTMDVPLSMVLVNIAVSDV